MIEKIGDQNDENFIKILPILALCWPQLMKNGTFMNNLPPVEQTDIEAYFTRSQKARQQTEPHPMNKIIQNLKERFYNHLLKIVYYLMTKK